MSENTIVIKKGGNPLGTIENIIILVLIIVALYFVATKIPGIKDWLKNWNINDIGSGFGLGGGHNSGTKGDNPNGDGQGNTSNQGNSGSGDTPTQATTQKPTNSLDDIYVPKGMIGVPVITPAHDGGVEYMTIERWLTL